MVIGNALALNYITSIFDWCRKDDFKLCFVRINQYHCSLYLIAEVSQQRKISFGTVLKLFDQVQCFQSKRMTNIVLNSFIYLFNTNTLSLSEIASSLSFLLSTLIDLPIKSIYAPMGAIWKSFGNCAFIFDLSTSWAIVMRCNLSEVSNYSIRSCNYLTVVHAGVGFTIWWSSIPIWL